ncbi:MAG: DotA/TraY family protein, partial [Pseudomonadota bacterium]
SPAYSIGDTSWGTIGTPDPFLMTADVMVRGWGGAGLWYNKISELNGSLFTAISSVPNVVQMPMVMQDVSKARTQSDATPDKDLCGQYNPRRAGNSEVNAGGQNSQFKSESATALYSLCETLFNNEALVDPEVSDPTSYTNPMLGAMSSIFSQLNLFDMRANEAVSPMVQLSSIGQLLIDKSVFNLIVSFGASFAGGMAHIAGGNGVAGADAMGSGAAAISSIFKIIAMIGMGAGVILHYIVPFMPFIYFFFAVAAWVKGIFEAMVGVPLWALAHLRKDGPGLPGSAASSGYFLLLEILIRPVVTVFALVATFAIFSALVAVLNTVFSLVVSNAMGGDINSANPEVISNIRSIADQFFMTILYIVIVYMIGLSCFKLINVIPDGIMRWSGADVASFGRADTTEGLIDTLPRDVSLAVQTEIGQMGNMVKEAVYKPALEYSKGKAMERQMAEQAKKQAEMEALQKAKHKGAPPSEPNASGGCEA